MTVETVDISLACILDRLLWYCYT